MNIDITTPEGDRIKSGSLQPGVRKLWEEVKAHIKSKHPESENWKEHEFGNTGEFLPVGKMWCAGQSLKFIFNSLGWELDLLNGTQLRDGSIYTPKTSEVDKFESPYKGSIVTYVEPQWSEDLKLSFRRSMEEKFPLESGLGLNAIHLPMNEEWRETLIAEGIEIPDYLPNV